MSPAKRGIHNKEGYSGDETRYAARRYLASLSPSGRRSQLWALAELARIWRGRPVKDPTRLAWFRVSSSIVDRMRRELAQRLAPATTNRCLTALRCVLREEWRDSHLSEEDYRRLVSFRGVRMDQLPGHAVRESDVDRLLAVCRSDSTPAGARDGAAIALLYCAGLRRAEAAGLQLEDLLPEGEIQVVGKGNYPAIASLGSGAPWVERWLEVRGQAPGPLLLRLTSGGKVTGDPIGGAAVGAIVMKRIAAAGLPRKITAHSLRRGFASELLRHGYDHLMVARALRHRDLRSVQRYDGRSDFERAMAVRTSIKVTGPGGRSER